INTVDFANHYLDEATGVAVLADGRIAVSGYSSTGRYWINSLRPDGDSDLAVALFAPTGSLDTTFDGDGKLLVDVAGKADVAADLLVRDGRLTLAGSSMVAEHSDYSLVRLNTQPAQALDLQAASDTGVSSTDNVTKSTSLGFDVATADAPYYRIYRNGTLISTSYQAGRTFSVANQAAGVQSYSIEYVDAAGNVSPRGQALQVTIDTSAPTAPSFTAISDDTGSNGQDRVTSDTTLKFYGSAEAGAAVRVTKTGVGLLGSTPADAAGKWMFDYSNVPLAIGNHAFTAIAEDLAGNTSSASNSFQVVVQPEVTVDDPRVTENTGATATLTFTVRLSSPSSSTVT
ncbi:MAG TPA: Ig-like domain-containing protein, partial [Pirellulaceae bacterium]|nr:Ig-like domain-containing protein [Pirellulaceae bacterium]